MKQEVIIPIGPNDEDKKRERDIQKKFRNAQIFLISGIAYVAIDFAFYLKVGDGEIALKSFFLSLIPAILLGFWGIILESKVKRLEKQRNKKIEDMINFRKHVQGLQEERESTRHNT